MHLNCSLLIGHFTSITTNIKQKLEWYMSVYCVPSFNASWAQKNSANYCESSCCCYNSLWVKINCVKNSHLNGNLKGQFLYFVHPLEIMCQIVKQWKLICHHTLLRHRNLYEELRKFLFSIHCVSWIRNSNFNLIKFTSFSENDVLMRKKLVHVARVFSHNKVLFEWLQLKSNTMDQQLTFEKLWTNPILMKSVVYPPILKKHLTQ